MASRKRRRGDSPSSRGPSEREGPHFSGSITSWSRPDSGNRLEIEINNVGGLDDGQNWHICNYLSALGIYFKILNDTFEEQVVVSVQKYTLKILKFLQEEIS